MKSISRTLSTLVLSVLLISSLVACNNSLGSRGSNGYGKPQAPVATQTVQPSIAQPAAQPAAPHVSVPQAVDHSATNVQPDPQGDEIEQSLSELTNELDATDTLDDLK